MIGEEIIYLKEVDSTNRYLMDWLTREKIREGTIVTAGYQTAGRGMDHNSWDSAPGMNLTFSFLIYPQFLSADQQFYLNKSVSLALADFARNELTAAEPVRIKWPNDLYAGDHKLAGMLIQNGVKGHLFDFSVIGIGLNVNQVDFPHDVANPVSLKRLTGKDYNLDDLLQKLIVFLEERIDQLRRGNRQQLDADYLNLMYRFGTLGPFHYKGKDIKACIRGVNKYGQLILEIPGEKILECDLKEVKFLT